MGLVEDLMLRVKRAETPRTRLARRAYERLLQFNLPLTPASRALFRSLYYAHDAIEAGSEWMAGKFLYEPMVKARFAEVGARLRVTALPYIIGHARIRAGDDCRFGRFDVASGRFVDEPELIFGDRCTVATDVFFSVNKRITIGSDVGIASHVCISDSDGHPTDARRRMNREPITADDVKPVTIEDWVWIGRDAHILKGVTLGQGAIVAAGSVVVSDVPPGALAMGAPARVIRAP